MGHRNRGNTAMMNGDRDWPKKNLDHQKLEESLDRAPSQGARAEPLTSLAIGGA